MACHRAQKQAIHQAGAKAVIRVAVTGAAGRMGSECVRTIQAADDLELVGAVDRSGSGEFVGSLSDVPEFDVLVEFTHAESAYRFSLEAMQRGAAPVIGASGLSADQLNDLAQTSKETGVPGLLIPNFAIGAVLMMKFAAEAAKYLPNVEVLEMHHDKKIDAPSGTAIRTAELIAEARRAAPNPDPTEAVKAEGARGGTVEGVPVHSVRLPGLIAHQKVLFGGEGEALRFEHDSMNRLSFMEGVKLAVRGVRSLDGFAIGLDKVMD